MWFKKIVLGVDLCCVHYKSYVERWNDCHCNIVLMSSADNIEIKTINEVAMLVVERILKCKKNIEI